MKTKSNTLERNLPKRCGGGGPGGGKGVIMSPCGGIIGRGGKMADTGGIGIGGIGGMGMTVAVTVEVGGRGGGFGVGAIVADVTVVVAGGGGGAAELAGVVLGTVMSFIGVPVVVGVDSWGLDGPMRSFSSSGLFGEKGCCCYYFLLILIKIISIGINYFLVIIKIMFNSTTCR